MDTYTVDQASGAANGVERRSPRRMRAIEEKLRIVRETMEPGTSVAAVARRHGVNANLLFGWRRQFEQGVLAEHTRPPKAVAAKLLPVKVSSSGSTATGASDGSIEIELPCGARVRVIGEVTTQRLVAVLSALAPR